MNFGHQSRRRTLEVALGTLALVALAVGLSACGGTSHASSPTTASAFNSSTARADVAKYSKTPTWRAPGSPVPGPSLRGKTCAYVPINGSILFTKYSYEGFKAAAKVAGVKTRFFSTDGTNSSFTSAIDQAVAERANCIVTQGVNLAVLQSAVANASRAHIPLIESFVTEPSQGPNKGAFAEVSPDDYAEGVALGAYAALKTHGNVNGLFIESSGDPQTVVIDKGLTAELRRLCPKTCHISTVNIQTSDWATKLGPETSTFLTAHPTTNWVFPAADGEVGYVMPAIKQAGFASKVKMGSTNATVGLMTDVAQGNVLVADVGNPYLWYGYNLMDEALRAMAHMPAAPAPREIVPGVLFTSDSFSPAMNSKPPTAWYGKTLADLPHHFAQLWGDA